jgi:transposase
LPGLLDREKMAVLCRRFGVSRKTGYKILDRYNSCGLEGLTDRSRRPHRCVPPYSSLRCLAKPRYGSFMTSTPDGN